MAEAKIETSIEGAAAVKGGGGRTHVVAAAARALGRNRDNADEFAAYVFDLLQALREVSTRDEHLFLSYLMGLAAEEAIRLAEGQPSAAASYGGGKGRSAGSLPS